MKVTTISISLIIIITSCTALPESHIQTAFIKDSGWLGFNVDDTRQGVEVVDVYMNSQAAEAGIKTGDIITELDTHRVLDTKTLLSILAQKNSNDHIKIKLMRNEEKIELMTDPISRTEVSIISAGELSQRYK